MTKNKINILQKIIWATRMKSLAVSVSGVLIGTAMAFGDGIYHLPTAGICLLCTICIHLGTNMINDYCDFQRGVDNPKNLGPKSVIQAGFIRPEIIKNIASVLFFVAFLLGLLLVYRGGWPIAIIGIFSLLAGIFYTAGKNPLGYLGLGDVLVLIFFGPVMVAGTYYVQSLEMNLAVFLSGIPPGLLAMSVLIVNNIRDKDNDKKFGKNTLIVKFGKRFGQWEYCLAVLIAILMPVGLYVLMQDHQGILMTVVMMFLFIRNIIKVFDPKATSAELNKVLSLTGLFSFLYAILFSLGWVL